MMTTRQASRPVVDRCGESCRHDDRIETASHSLATAETSRR
jgi:hypothetical protein